MFTKQDWEETFYNPWPVGNVDNGQITDIFPPRRKLSLLILADLIKCLSRILSVMTGEKTISFANLDVLETQIEFNV